MILAVTAESAPGAAEFRQEACSFDDAPAAAAQLAAQARPGEQQTALAGRSRVWVVGTIAVATEDLTRTSSSTRAAAAGRTLVSRTAHGHVRVELWSTARG